MLSIHAPALCIYPKRRLLTQRPQHTASQPALGSRPLHLVVSLDSLRVARRRLVARSSLWWRLHKAVLLPGELRVRRIGDRAISLLWPATARCILRPSVYVVVGDMSALFILYLIIGGLRCDRDDVPGVEETGEEAEHCANCQSQSVVLGVKELYVLHSAILIRLSTEHSPLFTQTAIGGKMMAMMPRQMSEPHMFADFLWR